MGGMWGFKPKDDRNLAKKIFKLTIDPVLSRYYNPKTKNYKTGDQDFLSDYVYSLIAHRSITHDSYRCIFHRYSTAWPTQRRGNCFVGSPWFCDENLSNFYKCLVECRQEQHLDWSFC